VRPKPRATCAVLGTGTMGAPWSANLLHAGFGGRVWKPKHGQACGVGRRRALFAVAPAECATGPADACDQHADRLEPP